MSSPSGSEVQFMLPQERLSRGSDFLMSRNVFRRALKSRNHVHMLTRSRFTFHFPKHIALENCASVRSVFVITGDFQRAYRTDFQSQGDVERLAIKGGQVGAARI